HAHRSRAEVEGELAPDQRADVGCNCHRQFGGAERGSERLNAQRDLAVRLAQTVPPPAPASSRITPGAGTEQAGQKMPPIARSGPTARHSASPGSSSGRRWPSNGPPCAWKYHHGMPFIGNATGVDGASSGAIVLATAGNAGAFTVTMTASWGP